jgi:hypothetical protein
VDKKANDTFAFDLENRLDDFFSDSLPAQDDKPVDEPETSKADLPLKELKSTILSIDWEITDDGLDSFIRQVNGLVEHFAGNKVNQTLLKLLNSLGKYIRAHKSKAHPDTIKRIMAVYATLEESVTNDELSQKDKENMLKEEIKQFQRLKAQIINTKSPKQSPPSGGRETATLDAVIKAIQELKSMMTTELGAIRKDLERLSKK